MEIQIRTKLMHQIAEDGVAAHWKYKDKKYKEKKSKNEEYYAAVKKIIEKSTNEANEKEKTKSFAKEVTGDVLNQTIFVFTPKGDVVELPKN